MKAIPAILILLCLTTILFGTEFDRLKQLEESGVPNPDLYYNLGVGYWQTGQSGMATLYFLKALHLNSAHKLARENLEFCLGLSRDRELYPQHLFLVRVFLEAYYFMNLNRMAVTSLILLLLSALCLLWFINYDPDKERALPGLILGIALALLITTVTFTGIKAYRRSHNRQAVLVASSAELKAEASDSARRIAQINEGIILEIRVVEADRVLVSLPDGQSGWVKSEYIGTVR